MTGERRRRLVEIVRGHLDDAQKGETPTAHLIVATSLLTEIVEDIARQVNNGAQGESDGEE